MVENKVSRRKYIAIASGALVALALGGSAYNLSQARPAITPITTSTSESTTSNPSIEASKATLEDTIPKMKGNVKIGDKIFSFDPTKVETVRPDLFNPGFFSMFDVLIHLNKNGAINLEYHFDKSMNTNVIDSINGKSGWWYQAYYDGGWPERNVYRPDHYPWKDGTTLKFYKTDPSRLQDIYSVFKEEIKRLKDNDGALVIPEVIIRGRSFNREFKNVKVAPNNMRYDVFKKGITTALDVIISLGDQGKITYELTWMESIGRASIVKNYWVQGIEQDQGYNRCGFVYEAGSSRYRFFSGNHIHLPTDSRILNSPEYVEFFWICI